MSWRATLALAAAVAALAAPAGAQAQVSPEQATALGREAYRYGIPLQALGNSGWLTLNPRVYDSDGFLVPNAAHRYSLGPTHPPLVHRGDGSIVIAIQRARPAGTDLNWLPAPAGGFRLSMRLYWPKPSVLRGVWQPPPLERLP